LPALARAWELVNVWNSVVSEKWRHREHPCQQALRVPMVRSLLRGSIARPKQTSILSITYGKL
jgi:hypothetical protein